MNMDPQAFAYIHGLMQIVTEPDDMRLAVEKFLAALREQFVFDNVAAYLQDEKNRLANFPIAGHPVDITLEFMAYQDLSQVQFMLTIYNHLGVPVTHCNPDAYGKRFPVIKGSGKILCHMPKLPLRVMSRSPRII